MEWANFGFLYSPKDHADAAAGGQHVHEVYWVVWDGQGTHVHPFSGITSLEFGHRHMYVGNTEPAPDGVPHTHRYAAVTSFDDGHQHMIRGQTGPAIPLPGGGHYHWFGGMTSVDGAPPHKHAYKGRTGADTPSG